MSSVDLPTEVLTAELTWSKLSQVFSSCVNGRRHKPWSVRYQMKPVVVVLAAHGTRFVLIGRRGLQPLLQGGNEQRTRNFFSRNVAEKSDIQSEHSASVL